MKFAVIKRIFILFLAVLMMFCFVGCETDNDSATPNNTTIQFDKQTENDTTDDIPTLDDNGNSTANAPEGNVMLIIQCKVDANIGDKGREIQLTIYNVDTFDMYDVSFFSTSNYNASISVPEGTYGVLALWVAGLNVLEGEDYNFTTPIVKATGQTVNMEVVIGNGDWDGTDDGSINGTIDRDKTDDLMQEDGKDPIDWDKVDKNVEDMIEDIFGDKENEE